MALSYPDYFPSDLLDPVVAAEAAAERQFRSIAGTPNGDWTADYRRRQQVQGAAGEYVSTLVLAFAHQACVAIRAGELSSDRVGWFVEDFERRASVHAYYHLELKRLWSSFEFFHDDVIPQIHRSTGWLEHLDEREDCAISRESPVADESQKAELTGKAEPARDREKATADVKNARQLFPNRAAWLEHEMAAKDLTPNRIKVLSGLDPRTTGRIRQGARVGPQVLRKLAKGLSIQPNQIPND